MLLGFSNCVKVLAQKVLDVTKAAQHLAGPILSSLWQATLLAVMVKGSLLS